MDNPEICINEGKTAPDGKYKSECKKCIYISGEE